MELHLISDLIYPITMIVAKLAIKQMYMLNIVTGV